MKYSIVLEENNTGFGASVPDLPGCIAAEKTKDEVLSLVRKAIAFHIEGIEMDSMQIPIPCCTSVVVEVKH